MKGASSSPVIWDMTLSWSDEFRDSVTLPRYRAAGYTVVGLTVGSDRTPGLDVVQARIDQVRAVAAAFPDQFSIALTAEDIVHAGGSGRLALEFNLQGTGPLQGDIANVRRAYETGIRHAGLVWNGPNLAGSSSASGADEGLTEFGRQLVLEMNRVGIIVDGAHASYRTVMQAIDVCQAPFILSHTNIMALAPNYKNATNDQVKACAATGGVIGISGLGYHLGDLAARSDTLFRHIDYAVNLVGPEHVGIGMDFVTNIKAFRGMVAANPSLWPDENGMTMRESEVAQPEQVHDLTALMRDHGYSDLAVSQILGGNWLRVARACWR